MIYKREKIHQNVHTDNWKEARKKNIYRVSGDAPRDRVTKFPPEEKTGQDLLHSRERVRDSTTRPGESKYLEVKP